MTDDIQIPARWLDKKFPSKVRSIADEHGGRSLTATGRKLMQEALDTPKVTSTGGVSKAVYIPESYAWVLKVVHKKESLELDNNVRREVESIYYLKSKFPKYAQYLPECLYLDCGVGVMRKYLINMNQYGKNSKQIRDIAHVIGLGNDVHDANIGWLGDKFFFIDVGHDLQHIDS